MLESRFKYCVCAYRVAFKFINTEGLLSFIGVLHQLMIFSVAESCKKLFHAFETALQRYGILEVKPTPAIEVRIFITLAPDVLRNIFCYLCSELIQRVL